MRPVWKLGMLGLIVIGACSPDAIPARRATASALEPHPDWSMALPRLLPAIRACLANESSARGGGHQGVADHLRPDGCSGTEGRWRSGRLHRHGRWPRGFVDRTGPHGLPAGRRARPAVYPRRRQAAAEHPASTPARRSGSSGGDVGWLSYDTCDAPTRTVKPSAAGRPAKPAVETRRRRPEKKPDRERQPGDKFSGENRRRSRPRPDQLVGSAINTQSPHDVDQPRQWSYPDHASVIRAWVTLRYLPWSSYSWPMVVERRGMAAMADVYGGDSPCC